MTKLELKKCEKLMYEAIREAELAKKQYDEAEKYLKAENTIEWNVAQRKADQHMGYAEGVNQVLAGLNFKHKDMRTLSKLI